ncbi:pectinesterase/pectinesterase inhibitor PPE8B-like [Hibiscus syriacus]|uniref:diacylglycerol O-acyltransferase n=1 Tax=Hibiscus syriacus TaxID=106335 RepID=A0A6A3AEZ4_HIBSY|nr:pectinesterase/pectinesterase inhibitor PPE8B-like [Hibiscus syriacus]
MELKNIVYRQGDEYSEPVSPTGQHLNSLVLSICVLTVLDSEIAINDSLTLSLLRDVFLTINPRFSSVMVNDENGVKQWKKVEVKLEDHVNIPVFPPGLSPESYDTHLSDYLSKIAMEQLPHNRPLWNIHIIKYPTNNAAGNLIFKLHHSLGDGYSLMGAFPSCLQQQRADNPTVPLTFPSRGSAPTTKLPLESNNILSKIPKLYDLLSTLSDFGWSLLKKHLQDNDVIMGIIFLGTRSYMKGTVGESSNELSTILVLLNTRGIREYKLVKEMLEPGADKAWGNQFSFLHVSLPELNSVEYCNPLICSENTQAYAENAKLGSYVTGSSQIHPQHINELQLGNHESDWTGGINGGGQSSSQKLVFYGGWVASGLFYKFC